MSLDFRHASKMYFEQLQGGFGNYMIKDSFVDGDMKKYKILIVDNKICPKTLENSLTICFINWA